ncbi:hypothetical protein SDJN03_01669, partial [Cucurbita argyrosperma subsp. sororia]
MSTHHKSSYFLLTREYSIFSRWVSLPHDQDKLSVDATMHNEEMGCQMGLFEIPKALGKDSSRGNQLGMATGLTSVWPKVNSKVVWTLLMDQDQHFIEIAHLIKHLKHLSQNHCIKGFLPTPKDDTKATHTLAIHAWHTKHLEI